MKTLIIGARGLVGSALKRKLKDAYEGIPVEPQKDKQFYVDITKYETLFKAFSSIRPDIVYLPAAIAHVDKCEQSQGTEVVNVRGATTVLRLCESFESKLVYFSSSYVFNGTNPLPYSENDIPDPINNYGKQKQRVESLILGSRVKNLIIRTVGVFGTERLKKNFAKQVISAIFDGRKVFAPNDQFMNPILSDDLARITIQLASKQGGIWNVAGDTVMSKFQFAHHIASNFGLEKLVMPASSSEMKQIAPRPSNASLSCSAINNLGIETPSFTGGLTKFLSQEFNG